MVSTKPLLFRTQMKTALWINVYLTFFGKVDSCITLDDNDVHLRLGEVLTQNIFTHMYSTLYCLLLIIQNSRFFMYHLNEHVMSCNALKTDTKKHSLQLFNISSHLPPKNRWLLWRCDGPVSLSTQVYYKWVPTNLMPSKILHQ